MVDLLATDLFCLHSDRELVAPVSVLRSWKLGRSVLLARYVLVRPCRWRFEIDLISLVDYIVEDLSTPGFVYLGPWAEGASKCACSTGEKEWLRWSPDSYCLLVFYSMMSACAACQEHRWLTWSDWSYNCTTILSQT